LFVFLLFCAYSLFLLAHAAALGDVARELKAYGAAHAAVLATLQCDAEGQQRRAAKSDLSGNVLQPDDVAENVLVHAAMRAARAAKVEAAGAAAAQLEEQRTADEAQASMLGAHAIALDGAAAELESVWAAALAQQRAAAVARSEHIAATLLEARAERAPCVAGYFAATVAASTAALASAAAHIAALAARHAAEVLIATLGRSDVEAATPEVLDARALERALKHALAEKAELMMQIAEGRLPSPRDRGASVVKPLRHEPRLQPTDVHVGFCDKEGSLLKQSDWLRARRPRYFYVYGRALIYYHSQPRLKWQDSGAARAAASTLTRAGGGARLVADRPPDGCFILAAPPFEAGYDASDFNLCVACVGRQTPLVLFATSAADKTAWSEALGKTFYENATY
jgi:hypothetical protein